jgi:MFS family permease
VSRTFCFLVPNLKNHFRLTHKTEGAVVSVFTGGGFVGAGFAGPAADRWGRKWTILIGAAVFCVGGALQTGAQSLAYLYAGRALAGVGYENKVCEIVC